MMQVVYAGAILGLIIFISKIGITFFFPRWIKRTINYNNFTLLLFDFILGALAAKTLSIADGTIAMGATATFGLLSIAYIFIKAGCKKAKKLGGELVCVSRQY